MKRPFKVYLTDETKRKLLLKCKELGFEGRGALSLLMEKIANENLIFMDENVKAMLRALELK